MRFTATTVVGASLLILTGACGGSKPDNASAAATTAPPAAAQTAAAASSAQVPPKIAPAVPFEQLVALLPEAAGWTRNKPRGEQVTMGAAMSHAQTEYQKGESSIDLEITDSSFNQLVLAPMSMFLAKGFSERSSEGSTRSASMNGHPGFEKWNADTRRAEVTVVVANRFIVQAVGHNVDSVDPVRALVKAVDLGRLSILK